MSTKTIDAANRKQERLEQRAEKLKQQLQTMRAEIRQQKRVIQEIDKRNRLPRLAAIGEIFEREGLDHVDPVVLYGALAETLKSLRKELKEPEKLEALLPEGKQSLV